MKPQLLSSSHTLSFPIISPFSLNNLSNSPNISRLFFKHHSFLPFSSSKNPHFSKICLSDYSIKAQINPNSITEDLSTENQWQFVEIKNPNSPPFAVSSFRSKFSSSDQAFFLFTFITFTTCAAFVSFVAAAVPTLYAMGRAANSLAKLADAARKELPGTMAAVRLSGMEFSDLTLELTELSQEISAGVNKSAQAVEATKVGIQHIGARAREKTISAAKKTCGAVGRATRTFLNLISGGESNLEATD